MEIKNLAGREAETITATVAKNEFARVLETVLQNGVVVITKHDAPKAVVLSMQEFSALSRTHDARLDTLSDEFDGMLARMQRPKARRAMKAAFAASPKQLGRAAVAAARKRV